MIGMILTQAVHRANEQESYILDPVKIISRISNTCETNVIFIRRRQ